MTFDYHVFFVSMTCSLCIIGIPVTELLLVRTAHFMQLNICYIRFVWFLKFNLSIKIKRSSYIGQSVLYPPTQFVCHCCKSLSTQLSSVFNYIFYHLMSSILFSFAIYHICMHANDSCSTVSNSQRNKIGTLNIKIWFN